MLTHSPRKNNLMTTSVNNIFRYVKVHKIQICTRNMTKHKQDKQSKHTLKTPHTHTTNSVLADEQVSMFRDNESHPNLLKSYHANNSKSRPEKLSPNHI